MSESAYLTPLLKFYYLLIHWFAINYVFLMQIWCCYPFCWTKSGWWKCWETSDVLQQQPDWNNHPLGSHGSSWMQKGIPRTWVNLFDVSLLCCLNCFPSLLLQLVFSSSATVYGWPKEVPCTEEFPLSAANPYGRTKVLSIVSSRIFSAQLVEVQRLSVYSICSWSNKSQLSALHWRNMPWCTKCRLWMENHIAALL